MQGFPVAYVLMSNKSAALYHAVMDRILEILREMDPDDDNFAVELMISDFEEAIMGAMQRAFPNARARGCWFHFAQVCYNQTTHFTSYIILKTFFSRLSIAEHAN